MKTLTISEARNSLPTLVDEIVGTQEPVVVVRHGRPVVTIAAFHGKTSRDAYALRRVSIRMRKDFNKPMSDEWSALR